MDIQDQLVNVDAALGQHRIGHARRLLRDINEVSCDRFVSSMVANAINDIDDARFSSAKQDIHTAQIMDERNNFAVQL